MKRDIEWLEYELDNWARWSVAGLGYVSHCGSVEHRYNAADWGDYEGPPRTSSVPVDSLRALACERAIVALPRAPQPFGSIIVAHYLRRGSIGRGVIVVPVGRVQYRMARATYFRALDKARVMLANLLGTRSPAHEGGQSAPGNVQRMRGNVHATHECARPPLPRGGLRKVATAAR